MGISCLSKPLMAILQRRFGVLVHPHPSDSSPIKDQASNCFNRTPGPTSTMELSVVLSQTHPPTLSPPANTQVENGDKPKSKSGSGRRATTAAKELFVNGSSFLQRSKSPRGSKISLAFGRALSVTSDTSSVIGLMSGFYALGSLTAYETSLIPDIWQSCLTNNKYYCEHVLSRLFNRHLELENMFDGGVFSCPVKGNATSKESEMNSTGQQGLPQCLKKKAKHLWAFLHCLIITHELDYDRMLSECDRLGRAHAPYFYERGLQPCHWESLAYCLVQEYKKTQMNCDMNTDEKELRQLSWTHFVSAAVSAIKDAFEDEVHAMPVPNTVEQGEITYRF